jgi:hypothetical protein
MLANIMKNPTAAVERKARLRKSCGETKGTLAVRVRHTKKAASKTDRTKLPHEAED